MLILETITSQRDKTYSGIVPDEYDLTGAIIKLGISAEPGTQILVEKDAAINDRTAVFPLSAADTNIPAGKYYYEILYTKDGKKYTLSEGIVNVKLGVL